MKYIIKISSAKMPASCKYPYVYVALLAVSGDVDDVSMISEHARNVIRIVRQWSPVPARGKTNRCGFERVMEEARSLREVLTKRFEQRAIRLAKRSSCQPLRTITSSGELQSVS